jgi:hypothetical protein
MLMAIAFVNSTPVKSALVNWLDSNGRRNTLRRSCDDEAPAAFGSVWSGAIILTRSSAGGRTR